MWKPYVLWKPHVLWKPYTLGKTRLLIRSYHLQLQHQRIIQQLQKNHNIAAGAIRTRSLLKWSTVVFLVAASSSTTMALYVGAEMYRTYRAEDNKPRAVFLPLWISFDWPYQRRYAFPDYLQDADPEFGRMAAADDFVPHLVHHDVQYQVLDTLLRLKTARDLFGVPLSLRADEADFSIWVEPQWPLVHGPQVQMAKRDGKLHLRWKWDVKPIRCSSIDGLITALGIKLDRIDPDPEIRTHDSGRARYDGDYTIAFEGKFNLANRKSVQCGVVTYSGVIDFTHLGISNGVKILRVDLIVNSNDSPISYKLR